MATVIPANNLKQLRTERGFSQYDVEALTGIPQSRVSLVERGYRQLRADEIRALRQLFGDRFVVKAAAAIGLNRRCPETCQSQGIYYAGTPAQPDSQHEKS